MTLLSMTRGDKQSFSLAFTDSAGDAVDLTGATLTFTAKWRPTDTDAQALIQKTNGEGFTVNEDPTTGLATLTLDPEDTADIAPAKLIRSLYWDVQIDDGAGDVRTPLTGRLAIAIDMTITSGAS